MDEEVSESVSVSSEERDPSLEVSVAESGDLRFSLDRRRLISRSDVYFLSLLTFFDLKEVELQKPGGEKESSFQFFIRESFSMENFDRSSKLVASRINNVMIRFMSFASPLFFALKYKKNSF